MQIYVCVTIFVTERHTPLTTNRGREEQQEERDDATLGGFMRVWLNTCYVLLMRA